MIDDPTIQAVADKVRSLIGGARQQYARKLYAAGVELLLVADTPGAVPLISKELRISGTALYNYMLLPRAWAADEFTKMTTKLNCKGLPLTASHFIALARGNDKKKRYNLFRKCLKEGMTVPQVQQEMSDLQYGLTPETKKRLDALMRSALSDEILEVLLDAEREHVRLSEVTTYMVNSVP